MGEYKFFWMGCAKGIHGVGLLVADRWIDKVLEVKRVTDGGESNCREDCAELDFCICAMDKLEDICRRKKNSSSY